MDTPGLQAGAPPDSELYQTFAKLQPINRMARRKKSPKRLSGFCQTQPPSSPVAISSSTAAISPGRGRTETLDLPPAVLFELFGGLPAAAVKITGRGLLGLEETAVAPTELFLEGARQRRSVRRS